MAEVQDPSEGQPLRHLSVQGLATVLFDLGALAATRARNREALYLLSAQLERCGRKRQRKQGGAEQPAAAAEADTASNHGGCRLIRDYLHSDVKSNSNTTTSVVQI